MEEEFSSIKKQMEVEISSVKNEMKNILEAV